MIKPLIDEAHNKDMSKKIEKLYDFVHASQSKSSIAVRDIEMQIENGISELSSHIYSAPDYCDFELVDKLLRLAAERERILRNQNHGAY